MWFTARIIRQSDDIFTTYEAKPWFVFHHDLKHNIPFMAGLGAICKIHKIVLHLCWNVIHCFVNEFDELCKCRSDASAVLDSTLSKVCLLGILLWFSSHIHCLSRWFHVWFRVSITVARKPDDCQLCEVQPCIFWEALLFHFQEDPGEYTGVGATQFVADTAKEGVRKATQVADTIGDAAKETMDGAREAAKEANQKIRETEGWKWR